jgi:hypothetical protein
MNLKNAELFIRLRNCLGDALPKALNSAWWMIRIMLPVSLSVMFMQYFGILTYFSKFLTPVFKFIGLPGESAVVFLTSVFLNIYTAIPIIGTLPLDMREISILAIMCLISHNMIFETAVQRKTGSSAIKMIFLRIICSFICAYIFNLLLPKTSIFHGPNSEIYQYKGILNLLEVWFKDSFSISVKVVLIVTSLMFLQSILEEFGIMKILARTCVPLMKPMGLSEKTSFQWIIANTVGLSYGSAIMFDQVESGKLPLRDADLLNHHIGISHSLLEDTLLFVSIGVSAPLIIFPRIVLAILSVWIYKAEKKIAGVFIGDKKL